MDLEEMGNLIEGAFWLAVGAAFLVALAWKEFRWDKMVAAANFALFGVSDFIEMHTGAWWRPWWLLAWKGACVVVMATQLAVYVRASKRKKAG